MCSASASGDTVNNKSTLYVQSGLKYNNNLCGKCPERDHYNTLHVALNISCRQQLADIRRFGTVVLLFVA